MVSEAWVRCGALGACWRNGMSSWSRLSPWHRACPSCSLLEVRARLVLPVSWACTRRSHVCTFHVLTDPRLHVVQIMSATGPTQAIDMPTWRMTLVRKLSCRFV